MSFSISNGYTDVTGRHLRPAEDATQYGSACALNVPAKRRGNSAQDVDVNDTFLSGPSVDIRSFDETHVGVGGGSRIASCVRETTASYAHGQVTSVVRPTVAEVVVAPDDVVGTVVDEVVPVHVVTSTQAVARVVDENVPEAHGKQDVAW